LKEIQVDAVYSIKGGFEFDSEFYEDYSQIFVDFNLMTEKRIREKVLVRN